MAKKTNKTDNAFPPVVDDIEDEEERSLVQALVNTEFMENHGLTPREVLEIVKEEGWVPGERISVLQGELRELEKALVEVNDKLATKQINPSDDSDGGDSVVVTSYDGNVQITYTNPPPPAPKPSTVGGAIPNGSIVASGGYVAPTGTYYNMTGSYRSHREQLNEYMKYRTDRYNIKYDYKSIYGDDEEKF